MRRLAALAARRPGPFGAVLLVPTWVLLGVALVVYVVGMLALAFAAVLVATLRLLLSPVAGLLARLPGVSALVEHRRVHRYAQHGVAVLEDQLRARDSARRRRDAA